MRRRDGMMSLDGQHAVNLRLITYSKLDGNIVSLEG